jgi:glutamyl/glutaminyl-tRNA synthetase
MIMGITHVIRGGDHISNTPKQIALIRALGGTPPQYAHHSLLIGADRKPLSKRHGAASVRDFRSRGIVSEALVNYLCTMGRNVPAEVMDRGELVRTFSLDSISGADNIFDMEKLLWFNREYLKHIPLNDLVDMAGIDASEAAQVSAVRENASTLADLREYMEMFHGTDLKEGAVRHLMKMNAAEKIGDGMKDLITGRDGLTFDELTGSLAKPPDLRKRDFFMILRAFITGRPDGPPLREVFPLVPTDVIIARIDSYLNIRHGG